jgi:tetratricopeptide (TPR) repeat protein
MAELEKGRAMVSERDRIELAAQLIALAHMESEKGQPAAAVASLQQVVRLQPESAEAREQYGEALLKNGDAVQAAAEFRKAAEMRPDSYGAQFGLGRALIATGEANGAVRSLEDAVRLRPSSSEAREQLALALARQKEGAAPPAGASGTGGSPDPPISLQSVLRTISAADDPNQIEILEGYIRREQYSDAEPLAQHYVTTHPESSWGYYILGYAQFAQKKINDSIRSLAKSLQLDINNAEAHKILGRTLMIIGRFDAALVEMEQVRRLLPESAEARYNLGKIHSASDDYPKARVELEEAVRLAPDYMEAHDALGFVYEALGEPASPSSRAFWRRVRYSSSSISWLASTSCLPGSSTM